MTTGPPAALSAYLPTWGPRPAGGGSRWRSAAVLATLLVAILLVTGGCGRVNADLPQRSDPPAADTAATKALTWIPIAERQPAPVASGPSLSGRGTVSTGDYPGKVVVINVWGSWCGPCRLEARDLAEVSRETAKTAAFVGINIRDTNPDAARAFVRAFDVPYPHIYDPNGSQLIRFAGTLPPNGIPATLIIDRDGRIAARVVGVVDKTTLLGLIDDVDRGK